MSEDIQRTLGRMEAKLDGLIESHAETKAHLQSVGARTARLEKREKYVLGLVGGGAAVAGVVLTVVLHIADHVIK